MRSEGEGGRTEEGRGQLASGSVRAWPPRGVRAHAPLFEKDDVPLNGLTEISTCAMYVCGRQDARESDGLCQRELGDGVGRAPGRAISLRSDRPELTRSGADGSTGEDKD